MDWPAASAMLVALDVLLELRTGFSETSCQTVQSGWSLTHTLKRKRGCKGLGAKWIRGCKT
eukprot:9437945-Karenia_brevis.AAC.1